MSTATKTDTKPAARHVADSHDMIRVQGRPGEQPQGHLPRHAQAPAHGLHRRLRLGQVLPGLRHHRRRVAAPDQRDLHRVHPVLHAHPGPPGRRRARRSDAGDRRRPGADGRQLPLHRRHRHRRQRHAADHLQPAGEPHIGPSTAFSFNIPTGTASGYHLDRGEGGLREGDLLPTPGGMCPRCEGLRHGLRHRPDRVCRRSHLAQRGRASPSRASPSDAWYWQASSQLRASSTPTSRSKDTPRPSGTTSCTRSRPRSRSRASTSPTKA